MAKMIRYNGANYRSIFRFAEVFLPKYKKLLLDLYSPMNDEMLELYKHLSEIADGSPIDYFSIEPENHNLVLIIQTLLSRRSPTEKIMNFEFWVGTVEPVFIEYGLISPYGKFSEHVKILRAENYNFLEQPDDADQWMFIVVDKVCGYLTIHSDIFSVMDELVSIVDATVEKLESAESEMQWLNESRD